MIRKEGTMLLPKILTYSCMTIDCIVAENIFIVIKDCFDDNRKTKMLKKVKVNTSDSKTMKEK